MDTTEPYNNNSINSTSNKVVIPISEKTKSMGKLDEWNRRKFEALQENTQQQFIEYHKMLAYYQNELDKFRGKKNEEQKIREDKQDVSVIPQDEKTFSAEEFDSWSQKKFQELEENIKRQFHEYDLLLERYKKQLDKYRRGEKGKFKSDNEAVDNSNKKNKNAIVKEEIIHAITDLWSNIRILINKNNPTPFSEREHIHTSIPLILKIIIFLGIIFALIILYSAGNVLYYLIIK